jgi:glycosyltransferase involved in cell wall biosynthesis
VGIHLLYLIDSVSRAGAEQSLAAMAPHWVAAGMRLEIAYLYPREQLKDKLLRAGARLHLIGSEGGWWGMARRFRTKLREVRPDLVHSTLFISDMVARMTSPLTRAPLVSSLVNMAYGPEQLEGDPSLQRWKVRVVQTVDAASGTVVRRFHAISDEVARVMGRRLLIPARKIEVIPRGRDPETLGRPTPERREAARRLLGVDDGQLLVFAGARQVPQKGLDVLLRAFPVVRARLPQARLVLAGREGSHTPVLAELHRSLGLDGLARFIGSRDDIPDLLCAADVWVEPSRWEGGPGAILEAMALRAPIVASDLDVYEGTVIDDESALLVPKDDHNALAEAIVRALVDPAATRRRAEAAQETFYETFTIDRIALRMIDFYQRTITG